MHVLIHPSPLSQTLLTSLKLTHFLPITGFFTRQPCFYSVDSKLGGLSGLKIYRMGSQLANQKPQTITSQECYQDYFLNVQ